MIYSNNENIFCGRLKITLLKSQETTMKIKYNIFKAEKDEWGDRMRQQTRCMKTELSMLRRC